MGYMPISVQDRKRLWGRAASRCAFPDCRQELIEEMTGAEGVFLVGQEAHIVAQSSDGPRGESDLTDRDTYENLILLCAHHHITIDNDVNAYPVEKLLSMKTEHELWVRRQLNVSFVEQEILVRYGQIIDEWSDRVGLDQWQHWSRHITNPLGPQLATETLNGLTDLGRWMLRVIWPQTLTALERSFSNFQEVLHDFVVEFNREADYVDQQTSYVSAITRRSAGIYIPPGIKKHELEQADLVVDLMFELTRAANHVCAEVRKFVDPQFYLREGALLMVVWTDSDNYVRTEYSTEELGKLYPGLNEFRSVRESRDIRCPPRAAEE
jgi:hypothetical protein